MWKTEFYKNAKLTLKNNLWKLWKVDFHRNHGIFRMISNPTWDFIICLSEKANQGNWPSHASSAKLATRQISPHLLEMMQIGLKKWECGKNEGLTNSETSVKKILVYFTSSAFEVDSIISVMHSVWKLYKNVSFETIFALFVGLNIFIFAPNV